MKLNSRLLSFFTHQKSWVILDQLVFSGTSFVSTVLLARVLGIEAFGFFGSVVLFLYLVLSISASLVSSPLQVLITKSNDRQAHVHAAVVLQGIITLALVMVTLGLLQLPAGWSRLLRPYAFEVVILMAGFICQDFFRRLFLSVQQAKQAFLINIVTSFFQLVWLLIAGYFQMLSLQYALFIMGVTYFPSIAVALYFTGWPKVSFKTTFFYARLHFLNGKWLLISSFLQWWANNALVAGAGFFLGIAALGALRLAQTLFGLINAMFQVFENYATPRAAVLLQQSPFEMQQFLKHMTRRSFFMLLPVLASAVFFAEPIFKLTGGSQYVEYAYALQWMALLYVLIFFGYPVRIAIRVMLMNRDFFIAYAGSFCFTLLASRFMIRNWELGGAITALIINQALMLGYWQWQLARKDFLLWK